MHVQVQVPEEAYRRASVSPMKARVADLRRSKGGALNLRGAPCRPWPARLAAEQEAMA